MREGTPGQKRAVLSSRVGRVPQHGDDLAAASSAPQVGIRPRDDRENDALDAAIPAEVATMLQKLTKFDESSRRDLLWPQTSS
jgi:hypothetical protein